MSYLTKILRPDEQVLAEGKLHWIIYYPAIAWLVIGVILLFSYGTAEPGILHDVRYLLLRQSVQIGLGKLHHPSVWLFVLCAYIALLHAVIISIRRRTTEIAVTDRRVIYKAGVIQRHTAEMNMDKVESVLVDQCPLCAKSRLQPLHSTTSSARRRAEAIGTDAEAGRCARRKERICRTASGIRSFGSFHGNMLTSAFGASIAASIATA